MHHKKGVLSGAGKLIYPSCRRFLLSVQVCTAHRHLDRFLTRFCVLCLPIFSSFLQWIDELIKSSTENEIREELNRGRHRYQLNRSYIIGAVSRYIRCLINIRCYKDKLQQLIQRAKNVRSIIRPDRHFKRKVSHHGITNGFFIRVNL